MKNEVIKQILQDFDNGKIPHFFDLNEYESDYEIARHFGKFLRIGYIRKVNVNDPRKAIYIDFNKNKFVVMTSRKSILADKVFDDDYSNYASTTEIYNKILHICTTIKI